MSQEANGLTLPHPQEILLSQMVALMSAVKALHPLLDLLTTSEDPAHQSASQDLTEILRELYKMGLRTDMEVQALSARLVDIENELKAIRNGLAIEEL